MNVVVIYGPPAVGKLTVAQELSKITKMKVFHNHLTTNISRILFEIGNKGFVKLKWSLVKLFFQAAKKENVSLIYTVCYVRKQSDPFLRFMVKLFGNDVHFVRLKCDEKELLKRVKCDSRKEHNKLSCEKKLKKEIPKFSGQIPFVKNMVIDNTKLSAKKVAKLIKEKYKL